MLDIRSHRLRDYCVGATVGTVGVVKPHVGTGGVPVGANAGEAAGSAETARLRDGVTAADASVGRVGAIAVMAGAALGDTKGLALTLVPLFAVTRGTPDGANGAPTSACGTLSLRAR